MITPKISVRLRNLKSSFWSGVSVAADIPAPRTKVSYHLSHFFVQRIPPSAHARSFSSQPINPSARPFTILGLQQIAIGSTNPKQMSQLWHDIFGLPKIGTYSSISENVSEDILQLGPSTRKISIPLKIDSIEGNSHGDWGISELEDTEELGKDVVLGQAQINVPFVEVDLMCPLDESKSPKVHVPPLNHIGLWVDDLKSSVTWMKDNGVRFAPGGIRKGAAGYDVAFIHPKGNEDSPVGGGGVLIELVQAPPDVIDALKQEKEDDDESETDL